MLRGSAVEASDDIGFARQAPGAVCHELQRTLYVIAAATDLLDSGVLEASEHDQLLRQLRQRANYALAIVGQATSLTEA
jgi:hypothetical protein